MTIGGFVRAHPRILVHEGGYANDPQDPGGVTMEGVIQRVYDDYRDRKGKVRRPLRRSMKGDPEWIRERDEIYKIQYWDAVAGDRLPAGVDYAVYDGAVNSGPKQSIKWLQFALGLDKCDGVIGIRTWKALEECTNHDALIERMCARRLAFLKALRTWPRFGKGWTTRVAEVKRVGQGWASGPQYVPDAPSVIPEQEGAHQKAPIEDAAKVPSPATGDLSAGSGGAVGTITGVIEGLRDQLTPFTGSETISNVVLALGVIATLLVVGGIAYRFYARWKRDKAIDVLDLRDAVAAGVV
jgi:lysozyme family protein